MAENRWTFPRRVFWLTAGVIVLTALIIMMLWIVPQLQAEKYLNAAKRDGKTIDAKDQFSIENEARKTLLLYWAQSSCLLALTLPGRTLRLCKKDKSPIGLPKL